MPFFSPFLRQVIFRFDAFLSRVEGVHTFSENPDCILRLRLTKSRIDVSLPCGDIAAGDDVLEIHLWNEHMPKVEDDDPSIAWGNRTLRLFLLDLRQLAKIVVEDPRLSQVEAIRGEMIFLGTADNPNRAKQMERLGFTVIPFQSKLGAFGEFWENFYSWWVMWAYNPVSTHNRRLVNNHRMQIWMSRARFLEMYGDNRGLK